jgi:pantoate--beta-alanine ligase
MIIYKSASALNHYLRAKKIAGKSIGFVPTMGALHEGHISLIYTCKENNDITVCSIFINPTQFNNAADFEKYPVTVEKDIDMLEKSGCDILFLPAGDEVYPPGAPLRPYDLGYIETILEGKYRPGHFQGVCQVVHRLLDIIAPQRLYLGQKDYQQCMVIKKLVELEKLDVKVNIHPTLREDNGLAMSSRNLRLNEKERREAVKIHQALSLIKNNIQPGNLEDIKNKATDYLTSNNFRVDYVAIADAGTLVLQDHWDGKKKLVFLIAAYLNEVRLIDNLVMD